MTLLYFNRFLIILFASISVMGSMKAVITSVDILWNPTTNQHIYLLGDKHCSSKYDEQQKHALFFLAKTLNALVIVEDVSDILAKRFFDDSFSKAEYKSLKSRLKNTRNFPLLILGIRSACQKEDIPVLNIEFRSSYDCYKELLKNSPECNRYPSKRYLHDMYDKIINECLEIDPSSTWYTDILQKTSNRLNPDFAFDLLEARILQQIAEHEMQNLIIYTGASHSFNLKKIIQNRGFNLVRSCTTFACSDEQIQYETTSTVIGLPIEQVKSYDNFLDFYIPLNLQMVLAPISQHEYRNARQKNRISISDLHALIPSVYNKSTTEKFKTAIQYNVTFKKIVQK